MQRNHYRRLMRSSKLHEPQPYLEPNSPRSKMAARGLIPPGEASSISVVTVVATAQAATDPLEVSADHGDQAEQKHASDEGENGCSDESNPSGDHEEVPGTEEQSGAASSSSTSAKSLEAGEQPDVRVVVTEAADHHNDQEQSDGGAKSESESKEKEQNGTETLETAGGGGVGEEEEVKVKVKPAPGSLYADLGDFEPVNLLSFAYQIASGMVRKKTQCHNCL